jgi:glycosyltransferase involved in cell wall biosynthesis
MNRAKFIGETLESIISQATDDVEIVVVDGGSSDNTEAVVESYSRNFPRLRYVRSPNSGIQKGLPSNSGFDLDCSYAVETARGEYCWLMTDDDLVMPGAVTAVLDRISTGPGLIIVDAEVRNVDFSRTYAKRRLKMQTDCVYEPDEFENLFVDVCDHLTFVGAIIIQRSEWLDRDKRPYVGTGFIHVGVLFQRPFKNKVVVIASPLIRIRFGNALWGPRSFAIWNVSWPALVWSFKFSDEAKYKVVPREPWRKIRRLMSFRTVGAYSIKQYDAVIAPQLKSRWSFLPGLWVARFPVMPLKVIVGVRRFVRTGHWN